MSSQAGNSTAWSIWIRPQAVVTTMVTWQVESPAWAFQFVYFKILCTHTHIHTQLGLQLWYLAQITLTPNIKLMGIIRRFEDWKKLSLIRLGKRGEQPSVFSGHSRNVIMRISLVNFFSLVHWKKYKPNSTFSHCSVSFDQVSLFYTWINK